MSNLFLWLYGHFVCTESNCNAYRSLDEKCKPDNGQCKFKEDYDGLTWDEFLETKDVAPNVLVNPQATVIEYPIFVDTFSCEVYAELDNKCLKSCFGWFISGSKYLQCYCPRLPIVLIPLSFQIMKYLT